MWAWPSDVSLINTPPHTHTLPCFSLSLNGVFEPSANSVRLRRSPVFGRANQRVAHADSQAAASFRFFFVPQSELES